MVVYSGRTVEQAIEKGLRDLNLPRMKAHIKVISREKKGFLGFGKKPAQVSVEPIIEEIAHKADRDVIKVAPDAVKQPDDFVTSSKEETTAFKKVTKLITVSDNKGEAQEILKQPVATETFGEEVPGKIQEQPKATIIPLSVKHESSEEDATEPKVTSLAPKLEPVAQLQNVETSESEDDFSSFVHLSLVQLNLLKAILKKFNQRQMTFYLTLKKSSMKWMLMLVWRLVTIVVISLYRLRQTSQDVLLAITVGFLSLYNF